MPISRHVAIMRTAISPRLAIRTLLNIWPDLFLRAPLDCVPRGGAFLQKGAQPFLTLLAHTQARDRRGGVLPRLLVAHLSYIHRQFLAGAERLGRAGEQFVQRLLYRVVEMFARHNGVDKTKALGTFSAEALARDE